MFRKLIKNKKAQNTAEYAILISLVVAAIIAMQTFATRALNARIHDGVVYMKNQTSVLGENVQYTPYYHRAEAEQVVIEADTQRLTNTVTSQLRNASTNRLADAFTEQSFNTSVFGGIGY